MSPLDSTKVNESKKKQPMSFERYFNVCRLEREQDKSKLPDIPGKNSVC